MYKKLLYITLTNETKEQAIIKIKRELGHLNFEVWNKPISLTGNAKILELHEKRRDRLVKVDGPGFLIQELYNHFT